MRTNHTAACRTRVGMAGCRGDKKARGAPRLSRRSVRPLCINAFKNGPRPKQYHDCQMAAIGRESKGEQEIKCCSSCQTNSRSGSCKQAGTDRKCAHTHTCSCHVNRTTSGLTCACHVHTQKMLTTSGLTCACHVNRTVVSCRAANFHRQKM